MRDWLGPKASLTKKIVRTTLVGAAIYGIYRGGPDLAYYAIAKAHGRTDVGMATFFSKDQFTAALSPKTRDLIAQDHRGSPEWEIEVAEDVARELSIHYGRNRPGLKKFGKWMFLPYPRNAEDLLEVETVCKDKTFLLVPYLRSIGIEAEMMTFDFKSGAPGHMFVWLPRHKVVIDPTNPMLSGKSLAEYEDRFAADAHVELAGHAMPFEQWRKDNEGFFTPSFAWAYPLTQ